MEFFSFMLQKTVINSVRVAKRRESLLTWGCEGWLDVYQVQAWEVSADPSRACAKATWHRGRWCAQETWSNTIAKAEAVW